MNNSRLHTTLLAVTIASLTAACSTPAPVVDEGPVDWTDTACESPAYSNMQGVFAGEITAQNNDGAACIWDTKVSIYGISMASECALSGNIEASLTDQSQGLESVCPNMNEKANFVVGLSDPDLNKFGPSSVIVHFNTYTGAGVGRLEPIALFESLTAEGSSLLTDAGDILRRQ